MAIRRKTVKSAGRAVVGEAPLTAAERRELERRIKDADDPRRYLLVATTLPWFSLYYEIQSDAWLMDDPTRATLFKRRAVARAVSEQLKPGVSVVPCMVDARGRLVLSSIAGRKVGRVRLSVLPEWKRKKKAGE
ncbi:MAG: hypothetical protein FIB04_07585 [Gammaproteobacteria bacterium]|nr:hypothetical protein [Gammaproteobacteria bacterium]